MRRGSRVGRQPGSGTWRLSVSLPYPRGSVTWVSQKPSGIVTHSKGPDALEAMTGVLGMKT